MLAFLKRWRHRAFGPLTFIWKLRREALRYRWRLVAIGLLGVATQAQALVSPQITRQIIDVAYPARDFTMFYILSAIMVGLNLMSSGFGVISGYINTYVNNMISFRMRMKVIHALHRVPVSYVEGRQSGMFLERIANDADRAASSLVSVIPQVLSVVLTAGITLGMMANISPLVTVLVLGVVPLYYVTSSILSVKLRVWQQKTRLKDDQLMTRASETIQGIPTARLFGVGNWLKNKYTRLLRDRIKMAFGMWRARLVWGQLSWAVSYGWGVLLTIGGWYLVFQDRLTLGDAVALGMYIPLLLRPAEKALGLYQSLMASSVPAQRVIEIMDAAQNGHRRRAIPELAISRGLELQKLAFSYPGARWHMEDINLDLPVGRSVVILGSTGSGKTTLLRLLAGMFDRYRGEIMIDDQPLSSIRLNSYQKNVAMVMAENFFFSGSIMENMKIAAPHVRETDIREAAKIMGFDRWLSSLPEGYNTRLGVDGIRLSSGQTQKIAILRSLLKKPRILLLDEITSAMDVVSERQVLDGLQALRPRQNIIVLTTHRLTLTTEPWVDRIVVLDEGRIIEEGMPDQLYIRGGEYRRLMDLAGLGDLIGHRTGKKPEDKNIV